MAKIDITTLKSKFQTGDEPTQADFEDFIDSTYNEQAGDGNKFLSNDGTYKLIPDLIGFHEELPITFDEIAFTIELLTSYCNFYVIVDGERTVKPFLIAGVKCPVAGGSLGLVDLNANWIVADRVTGTYAVLQSEEEIDYDRYIPYAECYRSGSRAHIQLRPLLAKGEVEKSHHRRAVTDRYVRESGVDSVLIDDQLNITSNPGVVWTVHRRYTLLPISSVSDLFFCHHDSGVWHNQRLSPPKINNTQYDNGTDLVNLSPSKYTSNFLFRGVEDQDHCYIVLGNKQYDSTELALADNTLVEVPELISSHAMLLGRIIVQQNGNSGIIFESAFTVKFSGSSSIVTHDHLQNLDYASSGHTGFAKSNVVSYATSPAEEAAAFAAGAMIVIRTDLL